MTPILARSQTGAERPARGRLAPLAIAALVLDAVLCLPSHPDGLTRAMFFTFPHELPFVLLALAALPSSGPWTATTRVILVALLGSVTTVKLADLATYAALDRAFHPFLDLHLVQSAWHLGAGVFGMPAMIAAAAAALLSLVALAAVLWWATGVWAAVSLPPRARVPTATLAAIFGLVLAVDVGDALGRWDRPAELPGSALTSRLGAKRIGDYGEAVARLRAFRDAAASDPWLDATPLLDRLGGRDVVVVFIESYGASSLQNPLYAETHRRTLAGIETDLAARGVAMRSAWLDAPTSGGQSWLSHATLSSGLWIDNQRSHGAWLASPRQGLFDLARRAGYRTAAVMPAIVMDWPEGELMGFDRVLDAGAMGYRGPAFNWVTMPDQFTLAAFDRLVRDGAEAPVFAQVALISSHAPWVPIPELVAWDEVGDGRVFDRWAGLGDPPEIVWRDRDRVRDQYRKAIDYALSTIGAYAARHADEAPLMIVLGDHQPAGFVAQSASLAVPVHVIGPPDLIARLDSWDWHPGLVPDAAAPLWRMDAFRDRFVAAFSSGRPEA